MRNRTDVWKRFASKTYCIGCGKPGTARCYPCAMKERERVRKNCSQPGGQEFRGKIKSRPLPIEQMRSVLIRAKHPPKPRYRVLAYLVLEGMDAAKRRKLPAR